MRIRTKIFYDNVEEIKNLPDGNELTIMEHFSHYGLTYYKRADGLVNKDGSSFLDWEHVENLFKTHADIYEELCYESRGKHL